VQKDFGWTAGSISRKLRVENVKNRTDLQLLLKAHGPRVDSMETRGLFGKKARAKGYAQI
jgi:hypothetical protein